MENDWESKINEWLSNESQWFIDKLWQVVVELEAERVLLGRWRFAIPLERFKNKNQDLENVRKILINLDSKDFINVGRVLTSPGQRKAGFVEQPIEEDEKGIFYDSRTEISLTHGFKYLHTWLEKRQHPEKFQVVSKSNNNSNSIQSKTYDWKPQDDRKAILMLSDGTKLIFWGGNFGGLNELFKNINHDINRESLKEAISKCKQGSSKKPKYISASKWVSELRRRRPIFFKYFNIEFSKPYNYKLIILIT